LSIGTVSEVEVEGIGTVSEGCLTVEAKEDDLEDNNGDT
jgi:hypothetical protein